MKAIKFFTGLAALTLALTISLHVSAGGNEFKIDTKKSSVKWTGEKVTGTHYGNISFKNGSLESKSGSLNAGTLVMDMNSITCTDIENDEYNGKLIGHLKSDDFFGTANYPTSTLTIKKVTKASNNELKIDADITIKGTTKPVSFTTTYSESKNQIVAKGKMIINRTEYNIKYGSGSFFDDLGDKTIYDDFTLEFELVANK